MVTEYLAPDNNQAAQELTLTMTGDETCKAKIFRLINENLGL